MLEPAKPWVRSIRCLVTCHLPAADVRLALALRLIRTTWRVRCSADLQLEQVSGARGRQLPQPCQVMPSHTTSDCWLLLDSPSCSKRGSCLSLHATNGEPYNNKLPSACIVSHDKASAAHLDMPGSELKCVQVSSDTTSCHCCLPGGLLCGLFRDQIAHGAEEQNFWGTASKVPEGSSLKQTGFGPAVAWRRQHSALDQCGEG